VKGSKIRLLDVADTFTRIASHLEKCGNLESVNGDSNFGRFLTKMTDVLERLKKLEARVGTDEELKEADILSYFARESQAAKVVFFIYVFSFTF
jgi:sorting nexin-5/6/32